MCMMSGQNTKLKPGSPAAKLFPGMKQLHYLIHLREEVVVVCQRT
jgi:hypothetical protein